MYIACFAGIVVVFFLPCLYDKVKSGIRTVVIISVLCISIVNIYFTYQEELKNILGYAITGLERISKGTNNSVNNRQNQVMWAFQNNKVIVVGSGIGKGNDLLLESFYSLYYYRYGLIAILIYLSILIATAFYAYKIGKREHDKKISTFYFALFVFYLIAPIGLLSSCSQDTPKISFVFYGIMGLVHKRYISL
jgi:hypothetical protein